MSASQAKDFKSSVRKCLQSTRHLVLLMISMKSTQNKLFLTWGDVEPAYCSVFFF